MTPLQSLLQIPLITLGAAGMSHALGPHRYTLHLILEHSTRPHAHYSINKYSDIDIIEHIFIIIIISITIMFKTAQCI